MRRLVLFGAGKIADEAYYYFTNDSDWEVVAFSVDAAHLTGKEKLGLPVVAFEEVLTLYPPGDFAMFVAVGYQDLNRFRQRKYLEAKAQGYELASYICSKASNFGNVPVGDNCFILENAVLQPCCKIGCDTFIWSGNHIGHHASVGDHCYVCGQVVIGGSSVIEDNCFLGINSTIGHEVRVGAGSVIGAASLITRDVPPRSVHIVPETPRFRLDSESFLKLTKMK